MSVAHRILACSLPPTPATWRRIIRNGDVVHPMEREVADLISKARKAELSWTHQFDHPLEGRFIEPLAKKFGLDPEKLLNYDAAEVLLVPRNRTVASRMPGYRVWVRRMRRRHSWDMTTIRRLGAWTRSSATGTGRTSRSRRSVMRTYSRSQAFRARAAGGTRPRRVAPAYQSLRG